MVPTPLNFAADVLPAGFAHVRYGLPGHLCEGEISSRSVGFIMFPGFSAGRVDQQFVCPHARAIASTTLAARVSLGLPVSVRPSMRSLNVE